jgi:hypothetical protein
VKIAGGAPGQVIVRLNMDSITTAVTDVVIKNVTTGAQTDFAQESDTVKLSVSGSATDTFQASAVDVQGHARPVQFTVDDPPLGNGNLLARAAQGTVDPTRAQIDAYNAAHPTTPVTGAGVCAVTLSETTADGTATTMPIPLDSITDGAFSYAFNGNAADSFALQIQYEGTAGQCNGSVDTLPIARVQIQVSNPLTGKVIKTLDLPVPPRDEPLNLGRIADDTTPPMVTTGPSRVDSFDPSGNISFTFSESMDADSVKSSLIVLDEDGKQVAGEVRISDRNQVATFVPTSPLQLGKSYTVTLVGNDSLGRTLFPNRSGVYASDVSGNALSTMRLTITTFKPHRLSTLDLGVNLRDVGFVRKRINGQLTTTVVGISNPDASSQGSPNYDARLLTIDVTNPAVPQIKGRATNGAGASRLTLLPGVTFPVGTAADPARSTGAVNVCPPGGTTFNGDLAVSTSFNTYYSFLSFYDVTDPGSPCVLANKLLTATPETLSSYSNFGTYHVLGFAKGLATVKTSTGYAAYAAVSQVGLMTADIGKNIPERAPQAATGDSRIKEGVYPGDYVDVVNVNDRLLALESTNSTLDVFNPDLSLVSRLPLPDSPRNIVVAQGFTFDRNGDGAIEPDESADLAFVAGSDVASGRSTIQVVDVTDLTQPQIVGSIALPTGALVRGLDLDEAHRRLFVAGSQGTVSGDALFMIDISDPIAQGLLDSNNDGVDDRVIWRGAYPGGIWGVRLDRDRGLVYVAHQRGLDVWAVYDNCCDLGVDTTAVAPDPQAGNRAALLVKEKQALQQEVTAGLEEAAGQGDPAKSCGLDLSSVTLLEQGSGACLWKPNPADPSSPIPACDSTYQPGLSDHDYEVLFNKSVPASVQACTTADLSAHFADPATQRPKAITLPDGSKIQFADVTFFPFSRDDFESARMNLDRPASSGSDATGDIGLGRQQLALLWTTSGAYVPLPALSGYSSGRDLTAILHDLRTSTGIPALEGYEWATLQQFNFAKSRALLRFTGASDPASSLHQIFVQQLHDAAKAAIRAAFARLVADPAGNQIALNVTRLSDAPSIFPPDPGVPIYGVNACLAVSASLAPSDWPAEPCTSFEEYAASAIARTLQGPAPLSLFTLPEVLQIYHYYLVKADKAPIADEASADTFIAGIAQFLAQAQSLTLPVYQRDIAIDPNSAQRVDNLNVAKAGITAKLTGAKVTLIPHVFDHGFRSASQVQVAMYRTDAAGSGEQVAATRVDLTGGEDQYLEFAHSGDGALSLDSGGHAIPLFVLGPIDLTTGAGTPHGVSFTIDLPERTVKEADRNNNVGGFFYYVLDTTNPVPPSTPGAPYLPLPDPSVIEPDQECGSSPSLSVSQTVLTTTNQTVPDLGGVGLGQQLTIQITVSNLSGDPQSDVTVCSGLANECRDIGALGAGESKTITQSFTVPTTGNYLFGTVTAYSSDSGVVAGAPVHLAASCESYDILPLADDPNPAAPANPTDTDARTVMRGGDAIRYYLVTSDLTSDPIANATVSVDVAGPTGTRTLTYTTDSNGFIVGQSPLDPASVGCEFPCMAVPFGSDSPADATYTVTVRSINGMPASCNGPVSFQVKVLDRAFTRQWTAGANIHAEATALVGLQGKAGTGLGVSIAERAQQTRQNLTLARTVNLSAGGQAGLETPGGDFSLLAVRGIVKAEIKGTLSGLLLGSESHQFNFPPESNDLAQPQSVALGGLLLGQLSQAGLGNPFVNVMLNTLVQQIGNIDSYKLSDNVAVGLEASVQGSAGIVAGFGAIDDRSGTHYGQSSFGLGIDGAATATASLQFGVTSKPLTHELVPNYQLTAATNLSAAMSAGDPETNYSPEKLRNETKLKDGLKASLGGTISGTWSAALSLDTSNQFKPKSLTISIATVKGFGWKAGSNGGFIGVGGSGTPDRVTTQYTITDPTIIQQAIDSLASVNQLNAVNLAATVASPGGVLLGPTEWTSEMSTLLGLLAQSDATYTVTTQRGDGVEFPLKINLGAGAKIELGTGVKFDRSIGFTKESGVIKKGRLYALESYKPDALIPTLPSDLSDLDEVIQTGLDAASAFADVAISTVKTTVQNGINYIKSNLTAQLAFDGASAGVPEVDLASFHYATIPGPVQPYPQRPADSSGPAGLPHYGIGGFHQFTPQDHVLGSPATLTFFFTESEVAGLDKNTLGLYQWDQQRGDWTYLGGTVDPVNDTITTTVNTLGLYTAAPPMPSGTIAFTSQSQSTGDATNPHTIMTFTSGQVAMNTGQTVPDGTEFTVGTYVPGNTGQALGTITTPDADPDTPGVQVVSSAGAIQFAVDIPASAGSVQLLVFPHGGTALGHQVVQFP